MMNARRALQLAAGCAVMMLAAITLVAASKSNPRTELDFDEKASIVRKVSHSSPRKMAYATLHDVFSFLVC